MEVNVNSIANCEFHDLLCNVVQTVGIEDYAMIKTSGHGKGDGYMGEIRNYDIIGTDAENKKKTLNLIVKSAPKNKVFRRENKIPYVYEREIHSYTEVFPAFKRLEEARNLPPTLFVPRFYQGSLEIEKEALVLDNLKAKGFRHHEKRKPMDENHVKLVLRKYGRLHALSFALRHQNLKQFRSLFIYTYDVFDECVTKIYFKNIILAKCVNAKELLRPYTANGALEIYEKFLNSIQDFLNELPGSVDEHSVFLHGDCWINNMLFKYEDEDDASHPIDVFLIDFQLSRLGSPVLDLSYFLYTCATNDINDNLNEYLKVYYDSLSGYLEQLGNRPQEILPFSVLQEHWRKYAKFGLFMSMIMVYFMFCEGDEVVDLSEMTGSEITLSSSYGETISKQAEYNLRIKKNIMHFITNGFI